MPQGTGRGDGDEGSPTNLHIGYLDFIDSKGNRAIKPYIRSDNQRGRRVYSNKDVQNFEVWRYKLVRMGVGENKQAIKDENAGNCDRMKPYIKIAEITDDPNTSPGVEDNSKLDKLP